MLDSGQANDLLALRNKPEVANQLQPSVGRPLLELRELIYRYAALLVLFGEVLGSLFVRGLVGELVLQS